MLGFKDWLTKAAGRKAATDKTGIQLIAAILACYPEIESVSYVPEATEMTLDFVLEGKVGKEELEPFAKLLDDSLQAYHELDSGAPVWMAVEAESHGRATMVHIHRQLITMTRGELTLITAVFRETFAERLKCDKHTTEQLEPEFADAQSAVLDTLLGQNQEYRIKEEMIGIRDKDRVVVYNR